MYPPPTLISSRKPATLLPCVTLIRQMLTVSTRTLRVNSLTLRWIGVQGLPSYGTDCIHNIHEHGEVYPIETCQCTKFFPWLVEEVRVSMCQRDQAHRTTKMINAPELWGSYVTRQCLWCLILTPRENYQASVLLGSTGHLSSWIKCFVGVVYLHPQ